MKKEGKERGMPGRKQAQISFEYLMVIGIAMMIIVPGALIFYNYSLKSGDEVNKAKIEAFGNLVIKDAEKVYYIGENSWETVTVDLPSSVRRIYVNNTAWEFVVEYDSQNGVSEAVFFSDVNITAGYPQGSISSEAHGGRNVVRITSMGNYVLINETR